MSIDFDSMTGHDIHCSCGRTHTTDVRHIDVRPGSLERIGGVVREMGYHKVFVISDRNTWRAAGEALEMTLLDAGIACEHVTLPYDEPIPDEHVIGELFAAFPQDSDLVFCAGSGTLNDLSKLLSWRTKVDYMVFASAPSMDGFVSIGAPVVLDHMKVTIDTHGPVAVFAEPSILAAAPAQMICAGVGDVLGKYTALLDWHLACIVNDEYVCDQTVSLVRQALETVSGNATAIARREPEAVQSIMEALLLTGLAMAWVGNSRPASGCEHHMSHVMEMSFQMDGRKAVLHGIKVGIAELACIQMYEMLASEQVDFAATRARTFDEDAWLTSTRRVYRQATPSIVAMEQKARKYDIVGRNRRINAMEANWPLIQQTIREELPSSDTMRELFAILGAPTAPQDVGIGLDLFCDAITSGRDVRDRWTLLNLLWDLGLADEYACRIHKRYA